MTSQTERFTTSTTEAEAEFARIAESFRRLDPTLNKPRKSGARTKDERRWIEENSRTGRKVEYREVDPTLPPVVIAGFRISEFRDGSQTWDRQDTAVRTALKLNKVEVDEYSYMFREDTVSGSKIIHRGEIEVALNAIEAFPGKNPIYFCIAHVDRLSRREDIINDLIRIFRERRVTLILANNPTFRIDDNNMKIVLMLEANRAQAEAEMISYRTSGGHLERAKKLQYRGTVPALGLTTTRTQHPQFGDIPVYTPDTEPREDYPGKISEADLVKAIFKKYSEGVSKTKIARWLNGERYIDGVSVTKPEYRFPTQRGGEMWSDQQVNNILHNAHYNGQYIFRGAPVLNEDGTPKKSHAAIIDDELWESVQILLNGTKHKRKPRRDSYRLSGLLVCANCGSKLCGKKATERSPFGYFCNVRRLDESKCVPNGISGPGIEAFVYDILLDMVSNNPERLSDFAQRVVAVEPSVERQDEIKAEIAELESLRDAITGSGRVADAQRGSLNASIAAAREELAGLVAAKHQHKMMTQVAFSGAKDFLEIWNSDDRVAMIMALKTIIKQIEIRPNEDGKKLNQWDLKRLGWKVNLTRVRIVWIDGTDTDGALFATAKKA